MRRREKNMQAENEDILLLRRYAETGDAEAFSNIVGRYQEFVYGVCLRVLGNTADAEDVAQECFLRLVRRAGSVRSSLGGWLHHCATDMSINEKKRQTARRLREEVSSKMNSVSNNDPTWNEMAPHVDKALDELPDDLRIVIVEHFFRRRTQAELAKEQGVSAMTISRRVDAGIEQLRKKLKKAGVIVSGALLAALISEHALSAAPAALTAALGKMAVAGAGQASAAGAATGAATGAAAGAAKAKIIAVAVAAVLAGGGFVAHKIASKEEPPPVNVAAANTEPIQPPVANAEEPEPPEGEQAAKEPEQRQAPAERTLVSVMPKVAAGWVWASNPRRLFDSVEAFGIPIPQHADDTIQALIGLIGVPEEVFSAPAVLILLPGGVDRAVEGGDNGALLLTLEDAPKFLDGLGPPDANGIYRQVGQPDGGACWMLYHGYAALSGRAGSGCLEDLAAAGEKTCELTDEAEKIMEGALAFAHFDLDRLVQAFIEQRGEPDGEDMLWVNLAKELKSADLALSFDEEGVTLKTLIEAREGSALAKYLVPSDGLGTLDPALPSSRRRFRVAGWVNHDSILETLIDDSERLAREWMHATGMEPQWSALLAKHIGAAVENGRGLFSGRVGVLWAGGPEVPVVVAQAKEAEELAKRIIQAATIATELTNELVAADRPRPLSDDFNRADDSAVAEIAEGRIAHITGRYISTLVAKVQNNVVFITSEYNDLMEKTVAVLQGKPDAPALNDDPMIRALASEIGLDNNVIVIVNGSFVGGMARYFLGRRRRPKLNTPCVIGLKVPKPGALRLDMFMPSMEKIELGLKLKAGSKYMLTTVTDQEITQTINDQEQTEWRQFSMAHALEVKNVDAAGKASVSFTCKRVALTRNPQMGPMVEYDSDDPPEQVPLSAVGLAAMVGKSFSMKVTPEGRSTDAKGFEELLRAMIEAIPEADPRITEIMSQEMKRTCDQTEQGIRLMFDMYPAGPVGIGDSWSKKYELTTPFPMVVDTTWTLIGRKNGAAHIEATSHITVDPDAGAMRIGAAEMTFKPTGPIRAKLTVDEETGLAIGSETEEYGFDCTVTTEGPPGGPERITFPMRIKTQSRFTITPVDND